MPTIAIMAMQAIGVGVGIGIGIEKTKEISPPTPTLQIRRNRDWRDDLRIVRLGFARASIGIAARTLPPSSLSRPYPLYFHSNAHAFPLRSDGRIAYVSLSTDGCCGVPSKTELA